jgi:hypothetical protein
MGDRKEGGNRSECKQSALTEETYLPLGRFLLDNSLINEVKEANKSH